MPPGHAVHRRNRSRVLALLALLAAATLLPATPAQGHAVLVASDPEDGAVLDGPPEVVTLEFSEVVEPQRMEVIGPDGNDLAAGDPTGDGEAIEQAVDQPTDTGEHVVTLTFVAADGHSQEIALAFDYTGPTAAADDPDEPATEDTGEEAEETEEPGGEASDDAAEDADEPDEAEVADAVAADDAEEGAAGGALPVILTVLGSAVALVALAVVAMRRLKRAEAGGDAD